MRNLTKILLTILIAGTLATQVYAANLSIRLEKPKSPVNQNSFNVGFVTLDFQNRAITVKCFKKGPADADFSQFGSTLNLDPGGNNGNCEVTSSIINGDGTYQIKAEATAGGETVTDQVEFTYDTSGPGDPRDYNKTKPSNCEYNIHFKTADDAGATVKVEVYRSENTSFNTDSGTRVGTVAAGSNETKDFSNTVPDCNKTYYYAIRSFDAAGNGSGIVGDSGIVTTTTVVSTTTTQQTTQQTGAIALSEGTVLGINAEITSEPSPEATETAEETPEEATTEEILGESATNQGFFNTRNLAIIGGIILLGILVYALRRPKNQTSS